MLRRRDSFLVFTSSLLLLLSACGGGSSSGGGGGNGPVIASLTPSSITVNVPLGSLLVSGSNFTSDALVAIDGQLVSTVMFDPSTLQAEVSPSLANTAATHQITVMEKKGTSKTRSCGSWWRI